MAKRYTDEYGRDAVRIAMTSGLARPQLSSDLGVGLSTLNKWVQQHQHDDLMSGPHEDVEKENTRLRKEVRLLREEREVLKKAAIHGLAGHCIAMSREVSLQAKAGEVRLYRRLEGRMASRTTVPRYAGHIAWLSRVAGSPHEPTPTR